MTAFIPRPYQNKAVDLLWDYFNKKKPGNPLVGLPTGTGKSCIPALFMLRAFQRFPHSRFMVCTHVKELISQNAQATRRIWPMAPIGICSAGLNRWEPNSPIILAGIASVYKRATEIGYIDILFIDEAHLVSPADDAMYQLFIAELRKINPNLKIVGLTATMFRMGQGRLTDEIQVRRGDNVIIKKPIFTDTCVDMTSASEFVWFIDEGYLSNLVTPTPQNIINVSDVRELAFDFHQGDLQVAAENITREALVEFCDLAVGRRSWMVFGAGVENCEHINTLLNSMGIRSCVVHSKIDDETRDYRIQAFKAGQYQCIVSYGILTTGFDHALVDAIGDLRPTTSVVLHVQKYGRGTRPYYHPDWSYEQLRIKEERFAAMAAGGKLDCLIADFAGNTGRLGAINEPKIPNAKGPGTGEVPIKICENCGVYNHTAARFCVGCGVEFVYRTKLKPTASEEDVIKREQQPTIHWYDVDRIIPQKHKKAGKKASLKLTYFCKGFKNFPTWLHFEPDAHQYARHKSNEWWRQHFGDDTIPTSTDEAFNRFEECRKANRIRVAIPPADSKKYPEILEYLF